MPILEDFTKLNISETLVNGRVSKSIVREEFVKLMLVEGNKTVFAELSEILSDEIPLS